MRLVGVIELRILRARMTLRQLLKWEREAFQNGWEWDERRQVWAKWR